MKIELAEQVVAFIKSQAPEPRHLMTLAIKDLAREKGDIKSLQADFEGFWRLRVKGYRVIFRYAEGSLIRCEFAETRSVVYDLFAIELKKLRGF